MHFRLITYNIHKGIGGVDRRYRPQRVIAALARCRADVVLLQEVDEGAHRSRQHRQVDLLGDALGLHHRSYQPNVRLREGMYGNAILSRFPLSNVHDVELTIPLKKRRRALAADCHVKVGKHTRRLTVVNLHLGLAGFERRMQLRRLLRSKVFAHVSHDAPLVIAGDFNDFYGTLGKRFLEPEGFQPAGRTVKTFPAWLPLRSLDRIYFRGKLELLGSYASRTKLARQASDHLPLVAEMSLK